MVDRYTKKRKENKFYVCPALWQRLPIGFIFWHAVL